MTRRIVTLLIALCCALNLHAAIVTDDDRSSERGEDKKEEKHGDFKVSGYIQAQYQWGQPDATLRVGTGNDNPELPYNRIGIRRGRVKMTYEKGIATGVFQLDITEKGIGVKDAYARIEEPWLESFAVTAGIFNRPFGYEIAYSSSKRESPERSFIFQTLFPEERDLGAMLSVEGPDDTVWEFFQIQGGLFAGNGIKRETDNRRDFIGQLMLEHEFEDFADLEIGLGASYYYGSVYQGTPTVYTMHDGAFVADIAESNVGRYAKREYIGFNAQLEFETVLGETEIHAEYIFGQQPGSLTSTESPNASSLPAHDTYIRPFRGGYVMLTHEIENFPVTLVAKYDWYDPNTAVSGNRVGLDGTGIADLGRQAIGFGALWHITEALKLTAYYDIVRNECTDRIAAMSHDLKDNMFTLRLQYKF